MQTNIPYNIPQMTPMTSMSPTFYDHASTGNSGSSNKMYIYILVIVCCLLFSSCIVSSILGYIIYDKVQTVQDASKNNVF